MINCKGWGKEEVRVGALMKMLGELETKGGRCFQGKHIRGIIRWKREEIKKN